MPITFPSSSNGVPASTQQVELRAHWDDDWKTADGLHLTQLSVATGESLSSASFHWRFGTGRLPGGAGFVAHPVAVINPRSYVKVTLSGVDGRDDVTWAGVWQRATKHTLHQTFQAVGLESLLNVPCLDLPYVNSDGDVAWAGRGLAFNANFYPDRSPNMHLVNGQLTYVFCEDRTAAEYWSTQDAVRLLLAAGEPKTHPNGTVFPWVPSNLDALPDFDRLFKIETHGRTFLQLLRSLVSRSRGVCWGCCFLGNVDLPVIWFDTFAEVNFPIINGQDEAVGEIPINSDPISLVFPEDQTANAVLSIEAAHLADQVIVTGDRRRIVATLWYQDGTLEAGWTEDQLQAYCAGASGAPDYPDDPAEQDARDKAARNVEALRPVLSRLVIPDDWDQQVSSGQIGPLRAPVATNDDDPPTQFHLFAPSLEFAVQLPLLTGYRYDGSRIEDLDGFPGHRGEEVNTGAHENLPILCAFQLVPEDEDAGTPARWAMADQIGRRSDQELEDDGPATDWSAEVRVAKGKSPALELRVHGQERHIIGLLDVYGLMDELPGSVNWQYAVITVCFHDTRDAEARYPADGDVTPIGDQVSTVRLQAPGYGAVYVVPATVVDVDGKTGALLRTDGGWLIDERDQLLILAERAFFWHRVPRYALQLSTAWIDGAVKVGQLVTQITDPAGTWPVNSAVTEITYEYPVASGTEAPVPRMTITTAFAELDATALKV